METITVPLSGHYSYTTGIIKLYKYFGVFLFLGGIIMLISMIVKNDIDISLLSVISNLLIGLYFIIVGFGIIQIKVVEYIKINDQRIIYKPYFFKSSKIVEVKDIKEISFAPLAINLKSDNNDLRMNLRWVSFKTVRRIKETIKTLASQKQIKITE